MIDASVFDRRGQPVLDLRPDEFELSEDGVRQQRHEDSLTTGDRAPDDIDIVVTAFKVELVQWVN